MTHQRQAIAILLLAAAVSVAGWLRFDSLGEPSYWLDEALGHDLTTAAAGQPLWMWIVGFEAEHGPLYYAIQLAARLFGEGEGAARSAAAACGVLTVLLVFFAFPGREEGRADREMTALISGGASALLLAFSPLHVYYSREARPYALLMLLAALMVVALLRASVPIAIAAIAAAAWTSAVGAPLVAAMLVAAVAAAWLTGDRMRRRRLFAIAAGALLALPLFRLLYRGTPSVTSGYGFPPLDAGFFDAMLRAFSVTALEAPEGGRTAWAIGAFAVLGIAAVARRDRAAGAIVALMTVLPVVFALVSLRYFDHWYAVRYVCVAIVSYLIAAGAGIVAVAQVFVWPLRNFPRTADVTRIVLSAAIVIAVMRESLPAARREPFHKLDWRLIASTIVQRAEPGDVVIAAEPWSEVSLRFYLRRYPKAPRLVRPHSASQAEALVTRSPATWMVSAGVPGDAGLREWMCGRPIILASALEDFRLHYAPSLRHFLVHRARAAEHRAFNLAAGNADRIFTSMGREDEILFGEGWGDAELADGDPFRWMTSRAASLLVRSGTTADRKVRLRVVPYAPDQLPPQKLEVALNGRSLGTLTLDDRWEEHSVAAPSSLWSEGINELTFRASHAAAPARFDPASNDRRELAVAFDAISVDRDESDRKEPAAEGMPLVASGSIWLATRPLLDERTAWRDTTGRFRPELLRRDAVVGLVARLGHDPEYVWSRLESGELRLDDVIETVAWESRCEDDRAFLDRAFALLLLRRANEDEKRDLFARLRSGASRQHVIERIARSDDFRRSVTRE